MRDLMPNNVPISLFEYLKAYFGDRIHLLDCTKATLVHLSHTIEDVILRERMPAVLFTGFQESSHWRAETERYRALAEVAQQVCIFAGGSPPPESNEREIHVTLEGDDPLRQEWFVCALTESFSVVLCGQDHHASPPDEATRQFATFWTFEPEVVSEVLDLLEQVVGQYRPERLAALQQARVQLPPVIPSPRLLSILTRELIRFEEKLHTSLRRREQQYQVISELTADYIYTLEVQPDQLLISQWVTNAFIRITGYTPAELEKLGGWQHVIHPDDMPQAHERNIRLLNGQEDVRDLRIITKSGDIRWIRDYARPNWDPREGRVVTIVGAARDITVEKQEEEQRLQLERQMQETQKLESLGVLAGGIAHDFNNLLASILGHAGLALMDLPANSPARESLELVESAAQRAADLTRQLLAYVGKGRFVVQPVHINTVISELAQLLHTVIAKHVALRYQLAPDLPSVQADITQLRQIVMNLVVNAAEAIASNHGQVTVTTRVVRGQRAYLDEFYLGPDIPEGWYVALEVSDTGSGMDAATVERIFEPFYTTKSTGRGLGLAAVLGIVRSHRGAIKVVSTLGAGTTFTIVLPANDDHREQDVLPPEQTIWRGHGTVLVVDDEPGVRGVAVRMLERWGFEAIEALDGRRGFELFLQHANDIRCILLDLTMPELSGEEVFRRIREHSRDTPIILMSGYNEQEVSLLVIDDERTVFLQKPFTPQNLQSHLRHLLPQG